MKQRFTSVAAALAANGSKITQELLAAQGKPADIGGYYFPDDATCAAAMRPSVTLNAIIDRESPPGHGWPDLRRDETVAGQAISLQLESLLKGTRVTFAHAGFSRTTDISEYPFG